MDTKINEKKDNGKAKDLGEIELYSDSARTALVANGTDTGKAGGAVAITEQNSSGITGTSVTIIVSAVANASWTLTISEEIDRYDADDVTGDKVKGIATVYDSDSNTLEVIPRGKFVLDGVGKDNVDDKFKKNTMITTFKSAGIDLV